MYALERFEEQYKGRTSYVSSTYTNNVLPPDRESLIKALDYLSELDDDWNGCGAESPSDQAVRMSRFFIEKLPLNRIHANKISPDGEGGILFVWDTNKDRIILTIDGASIYLSHEIEGQDEAEYVDEEPFFSSQGLVIPRSIQNHIPLR